MHSLLNGSRIREAVKKLISVDISLRHLEDDGKFYKLMARMLEIGEMRLNRREDVIKQLKSIESNENVINFLLLNLIKVDDHFVFKNLELSHLKDSRNSLKTEWNKMKDYSLPWNGETLFLKGEHSDYIRKGDEKDISKFFPNSKIEIISKSGHWPHFDNQSEFINKLISFLH